MDKKKGMSVLTGAQVQLLETLVGPADKFAERRQHVAAADLVRVLMLNPNPAFTGRAFADIAGFLAEPTKMFWQPVPCFLPVDVRSGEPGYDRVHFQIMEPGEPKAGPDGTLERSTMPNPVADTRSLGGPLTLISATITDIVAHLLNEHSGRLPSRPQPRSTKYVDLGR